MNIFLSLKFLASSVASCKHNSNKQTIKDELLIRNTPKNNSELSRKLMHVETDIWKHGGEMAYKWVNLDYTIANQSDQRRLQSQDMYVQMFILYTLKLHHLLLCLSACCYLSARISIFDCQEINDFPVYEKLPSHKCKLGFPKPIS